MMKIALCQMSNSGSVSENLKKSIKAIERAAADGAQLILFPEVQLTEFSRSIRVRMWRITG